MAENTRYYEYLNDNWLWYNPVQDLFLFRPSDANHVSGASFDNSLYNDVIATSEYSSVKTELINMRDGTRLVIGGTDHNGINNNILYYDAHTSQKAAYAVNFAGDGEIDFSNNTGAGNIRSGFSTDPSNSDIQDLEKIGIYVGNSLDIQDGWVKGQGDTVTSTHNSDAFAINAAGKITVNGNLNARFQTTSNNNWMANYRDVTGSTPVWVDIASSNTARTAAFRVDSLIVKGDFTSSIISTVNNYTGRVKKSATISGNTISAYGIWTDAAMTINGLWDSEGNIYVSASGTNLGNVLDEMETNDQGAVTGAQNVSISNNTISAIGIQAGNITLGNAGKYVRAEDGTWSWEDAGTINSEVIGTQIFFNVLSTDAGSYSINGNTIQSMAISGTSLTVNGSFEASLTSTVSDISISPESVSVAKTLTSSWSNTFEQYGINLTNALVSSSNFGGEITINYFNDFTNFYTALLTDFDINGINAPTISVNSGVFRTDITINASGVTTNPKGAIVTSYVIGINTNTFSTDAYSGRIDSSVDNYSATINCGIFVEGKLTNTNDGIFDITGDIYTAGGTYAVGIMGGFSDGHNLRISGSVTAYGSYSLAIVAGEITSSFLYLQSNQNDRISVAAGGYVRGIIELGNGQNMLTVDSNARINGGLYSSGGTLNLEYVLNNTPMSGVTVPNAQQAIISSGTNLGDQTNVTVNLNNAETGDYILYQNNNGLDDWELRTINFKYQGIDRNYATSNDLSIITDPTLGFAEFSASGLSGKIAANGGSCIVWNNTTNQAVLSITSEIVNNQVVFHVETLPTDPVIPLSVVEELAMTRNENNRTATLSWVDNDSNAAQSYELEYRFVKTDLSSGQVTTEKSIVQMVDPSTMTWNSSKNSFVSSDGRITMTADGKVSVELSGLDPDTTVEWRVRQNQGNGDLVSNWNDFSGTPVIEGDDSYLWSCEKPTSANFVLGKSGASAVAELTWTPGEATEGIKYYKVRYFQAVDRLEGDDEFWEKTWQEVAYIEKSVSSESLLVSGLNNQEYFYWQVQAIDEDGHASEWTPGELFRVYNDDNTAPVFSQKPTSDVKYVIPADPGSGTDPFTVTADTLDLILNWKAATDDRSGVSRYTVSWKLSSDTDWSTVDIAVTEENKTDYQFLLSNYADLVANGTYQWQISASDYVGRTSTVQTGTWTTDTTGPAFDTGSVQSVSSWEGGSKPLSITVVWDAAKDEDDGSGMYYYQLRYKSSTSGSWTVVNLRTSELSTTLSLTNSAYYDFELSAFDKAGNESSIASGIWYGDSVAPTLDNTSEIAVRNSYDPTTKASVLIFDWSTASDTSLGPVSGFAYYELAYYDANDVRHVLGTYGEDTLSASITFPAGKLADGYYNWSITAYDNAGNGNEYFGSDFLIDTKAPTGSFQSPSLDGHATLQETGSTSETVLPAFGGTPVVIGDPTYTWAITDIWVTFTFNGNFTDNSGEVYYVLQMSDNATFTGDNTHEFTTDQDSLTLDSTNGYGAGAMIGNGRLIYWRIQAMDASGNRTGAWTLGTPFYFVHETTGEYIPLQDTTIPTNITGASVSVTDKNTVNTVTLSWDASYDLFGVESYEITYSAKGVSKKTITISATDTSTILKFQNGSADGLYSWSVRAVDYVGNKSEWFSGSQFLVDTINPVMNASSFKIISVQGAKDIGFTWAAAKDANLYYYQIKVIAPNGEVSYVNTADTSYWIYNQPDGIYSFSVRAVDLLGNTSEWSDPRVFLVETKAEPGSTFETAAALGFTGSRETMVGGSDPGDMFKLTLTTAASVTITLADVETLEGKTTGVKVNVYDSNGKKIKSLSIKSGTKSLEGLLLDVSGSSTNYYVEVVSASGDANVAKYTISATKQDFADPTANTEWKTATAIPLTNGSGSFSDGWVGFGDAADYYKFTSTDAGNITIDFSGIDSATSLKVSLYVLVDGKYKKMASTTVKSDMDNIFKKNVLAQSGEYYLVVESGDKGKGRYNSYYDFSVNDEYFPTATVNNDTDHPDEKTLVSGGMNTDVSGWVGFGDATNCYLLKAAGPGIIDFSFSNLEAGTKIKVSLYDLNGKKIKSYTVTDKKPLHVDDMLLKGDCYLVVDSGDKGKGKDNTSYLGSIVYNAFPTEATSNNTLASAFETANTVNFTGAVAERNDEWVGYGDNVDFFSFELDANGRVDLDLALDNAGLRVGKEIKVKLYSEDGTLLKLDSNLMSNELEAGKYSVSVEVSKPEKYWTGYDLSVTKLA